MRVAVGIDIAKEFHWVCAIDSESSKVLLNCRVDNDPTSIESLIDQLQLIDEHDELRVGVDLIGGIAELLTAMLVDSSIEVVHVPGLAVNRARQGMSGGEHKSDPRDAAVIADQVRHRRDLRPVPLLSELDAEVRLLVSRRRELVVDQTRRINRLRDLLASIHPGLERVVDPTQKSGQQLLTRYVSAAEIRKAGYRRLVEHIKKNRVPAKCAQVLADKALASARSQKVTVAGEHVAADIIRELAAEAVQTRARIAELEIELESALKCHPDAALIRSLPGMGATLTAEFISEAGSIERFPTADRLAAAAGLAPVLKQSGKVHYLKRASGGNKVLKRVFFQSAFCSLNSPDSKAFYARKRAEHKNHRQAIISLARRRVDVLHSMLRNRQPYEMRPPRTA